MAYNFANADDSPDKNALRTLAKAVHYAIPPAARLFTVEGECHLFFADGEWKGGDWQKEWQGQDEESVWQPSMYSFLKGKNVPFITGVSASTEPTSAFDFFTREAIALQPKIKMLFRYLCEAPKFDLENPLVSEACHFLWSHETHSHLMKVPPQQLEVKNESRTSFGRKKKRIRLYPYMNSRW